MIAPKSLEAAKAHARAEYPKESVGLVICGEDWEEYRPCRNVAEDPTQHLQLPAEDYAAAADDGEVICLIHSHPNGVARPSHLDLMQCEASGIPWLIITLGADEFGQTCEFAPSGWEPPLVGREFHYGVLDCYTLVRDWYRREWNITLPDFDHGPDGWWDKRHRNYRPGWSPYLENFTSAGFEEITTGLQVGDVILMQVKSEEPNHAAVYLGDGVMLHHAYGRLSERIIYGGMWAELTRKVIRLKTR